MYFSLANSIPSSDKDGLNALASAMAAALISSITSPPLPACMKTPQRISWAV